MTDIIELLRDLHKQATTERSHYYVASCVDQAIHEIERLRFDLASEREECAKVAEEVSEAGALWIETIEPDYMSDSATIACTQRDVAKGIAAAIRARK